LKTNNSSINHM